MKTLFHDDVLRFLYRSEMFQQLEEQEQVALLNDFARNEQFAKSVAVAVDFQEQLGKMDAVVPEIGTVDSMKKSSVKDYVATEDNISFFPFGEKLNLVAPLVVVMDTSDALQAYEVQAKGLILPLLALCTQQQRDCVVLVNGEILVFPHGQMKQDVALRFHYITLDQAYPMAQLLAQAEQIFMQSVVKEEAELLFMTANAVQLEDHQMKQLKNQQLELSVIALDTVAFEQHETTNFDKVFFPNGEVGGTL